MRTLVVLLAMAAVGAVPAAASGSGGCRIGDKGLSVDVRVVVGTEGISSLERSEIKLRAKHLRDAIGEIAQGGVKLQKSWLSDHGFNLHLSLKDANLVIETRRPKRFDDMKESYPIAYRGHYQLVVGDDPRSDVRGEAECWLAGDG